MAGNQVRIIGGKWKGRKLSFPPGPELRPTLGRVRETLFNWLATEISDSHCLDLFAGSGALGFEALSRGAASVTFVERERRAAMAISANLARLDGAGCAVCCTTAGRFLKSNARRWELVFVDPPFEDQAALTATLTILNAGPHLADKALIYVEQPRRAPFEFSGFQVIKHSKAGDCQFGLLAVS